MRILSALMLSLGIGLVATLGQAADWPQFRGPNGSGVADDKDLPSEWSADKNLKWKVALPGVGWSAPIVAGDKIFVTTAVTDKQSKPRPGGGFGGGGGGFKGGKGGSFKGGGGFGKGRGAPNAVYTFEIHCLDRATGKPLWKEVALEAKPRMPTQASNTFATETPVTDGERVYAYFGMNGLFCYDVNGKFVWKKDLGAYSMQLGWGTGSSPVLDGNRLFIQCDNEEKSFLIALDKKTGNELWKVSRSEKSSWSTPLVWKTKGRTEIVASGHKVRSYDPANGKVLWELSLGGGGAAPSASPVATEDLLIVGVGGRRGGGFGGGGGGGGGGMTGGALYAVKAGASGDITPPSGKTTSDGVAWSVAREGPESASPLVYQGYVYVVHQTGGLVSCFDAKTGQAAYSKERITGARSFWSSPWAGDGKIFCLDEDGHTFVLQAGSEFKVLGKNSIKDMFWSTAAVAGDAILLRGVDGLYCIKK